MKKKTLIIIVSLVLLVVILLIVGKKAGWFGNSGQFKEVEISKIEPIDIIETVAATGKIQPEVEVPISATTVATASGCRMYGSPDLRRWPACTASAVL
jgi:HlyD family secretion protein